VDLALRCGCHVARINPSRLGFNLIRTFSLVMRLPVRFKDPGRPIGGLGGLTRLFTSKALTMREFLDPPSVRCCRIMPRHARITP
jgi:hypothetical protein